MGTRTAYWVLRTLRSVRSVQFGSVGSVGRFGLVRFKANFDTAKLEYKSWTFGFFWNY